MYKEKFNEYLQLKEQIDTRAATLKADLDIFIKDVIVFMEMNKLSHIHLGNRGDLLTIHYDGTYEYEGGTMNRVILRKFQKIFEDMLSLRIENVKAILNTL